MYKKRKRRTNLMLVSVTKHAIERYRLRMFDDKSKDKDIERLLIEACVKGKVSHTNPRSTPGKTVFTIIYNDFGILVSKDLKTKERSVVTFLGDTEYMKWYKRHKGNCINSSKMRSKKIESRMYRNCLDEQERKAKEVIAR